MPKAHVLEMSDEEFLKLPESSFDEPAAEEKDESADDEQADNEGNEAPAGDEEAGEGSESEGEEEESESDEKGEQDEKPDDDTAKPDDKKSGKGDASGDAAGKPDGDGTADDGKPGEQPDANKPADGGTDKPVDHEAFYKQVTAAFKANGQDMQISDPADIVRLMQMGANYNKKMVGLKPSLKILKTLEKAGISEERLNYLIDLDKKDPAAIAKLIKDAGVDPEEIDLKQGDTYTAADHSANDTEMALDEVINEIKDSPHYPAVLQLVAKTWDAASKQLVVDSPQLLKTLHDHMANGVYGVISTELEKERMFGRLSGMSDLQAYEHVGDAIHARGGFNHLFTQEQRPEAPANKDTANTDKAAAEKARKDKKRAAAPPKAAAPKGTDQDFNPLAMSDEEFLNTFK